MAVREEIIINIDEDGKIEAKTNGFKGKVCLDALDEILEGLEEVSKVEKTSSYYQRINLKQKSYLKVGK